MLENIIDAKSNEMLEDYIFALICVKYLTQNQIKKREF